MSIVYVCVSIISLININKLQLLISNEFYDKKFCLTNEKLLPPPLLSSGCNTQCFDTTGLAPTQTYLRSSLADNVFSSKYC